MLTSEPNSVYAGTTVQWTKTVSDYPATDGWTLHYSLKNAQQVITFDAASDGGDYAVTVSATDSAEWVEGNYSLTGYVSKTGGGNNSTELHVVVTGQIEIRPSPASTEPSDGRSHNRKVLDAINAIMEGREDVSEYMIGGYSLKTMPIADLMKWQQVYAHKVLKEQGRLPAFHGARFDGGGWFSDGGMWSSR